MNKINIEDFITKENLVELDDKTAAMVYGGNVSSSFEQSLNRLTSAFDEAIYRSKQLEALKIQKGQELKAVNTYIDQK